MSKKIYGDLSVSGAIDVNGKTPITSVNTTNLPDSSGAINEVITGDSIRDLMSILPVSRIGEMNMLPLSVTDKFEGSTWNETLSCASIIENDGTMVYLRPGTNGSTLGVYYQYISNVRTSTTLQSVQSTYRYNPAFIPSGFRPVSILASDSKVLIGHLGSESDYSITPSTLFISITNGTFDQLQHSGTTIPLSTFGTIPKYTFISGNYVYFLRDLVQSTEGGVGIEVSRMLVSDVVSGIYTSFEKLTNWNSTGFYGLINDTNIKFSNTFVSTAIADKPFYLLQTQANLVSYSSNYWVCVQAAPSADGSTFRVMYVDYQFASTSTYGFSTYFPWAISFVVNPSTKTVTLDSNYLPANTGTQAPIIINFSTSTLQMPITTRISIDISKTDGYPFSRIAYPNQFIADDNFSVSVRNATNTGKWHVPVTCSFTKGVSKYDLMNILQRTAPTNIIYTTIFPQYGSWVGFSPLGLQPLGNNKFLCGSQVRTFDVEPSSSISLAKFTGGPTRTYTYDSVKNGSLTGFEPSTDRVLVDDNSFSSIISIIDSTNNVTMYGGHLLPSRLSNFYSCNSDLVKSGTISISETVLNNLGSAVLTQAGANYLSGYVGTEVWATGVSGIIDYVVVTILNPSTLKCEVYYARVNFTISTSGTARTITGASIVSISYHYLDTVNYNNSAPQISVSLDRQKTVGGLTIKDFGTSLLYSFLPSTLWYVVGNSRQVGSSFLYTKSTSVISNTVSFPTFNVSVDNQYWQPTYVPSIGWGFVCMDPTQTDISTKCLFKCLATTEAQYKTWSTTPSLTSTPLSTTVVVSQDLKEGYIVYFTDNTPSLINGKFHSLPVKSINLTSIKADPSNSTFYTYVQVLNDVADYYITLTEEPETLSMIYLGKVTTDTNKISAITVNKVSRLENYRTSLTSTGSSIPSSTGPSSSTGSMLWDL